MKIFSLSHLVEIARRLPSPVWPADTEDAHHGVIRIPIRDWDAVLDAEHPEREFEVHANDYVEFELIPWKDTKGTLNPRWVLRGLVAI